MIEKAKPASTKRLASMFSIGGFGLAGTITEEHENDAPHAFIITDNFENFLSERLLPPRSYSMAVNAHESRSEFRILDFMSVCDEILFQRRGKVIQLYGSTL